MICRGYGSAGLWRFPEQEAALSNHSVQSPASVWVACPGHIIRHCKIKCSLCSHTAGVVEPALGAPAGLGRWFVGVAVLPVFLFPEEEAGLGNHIAQSPASV